MSSILERLQLDIAGRLDSIDSFSGIPVTVVRPRSEAEAVQIRTEIDNTLAGLLQKNGKSGAAVIVGMPDMDVPDLDIPGPFLELTVKVRVIEAPLINMGASGTQLSAEQIAINILSALHQWDTGSSGSPLYADKKAGEPNNEYPGKVVYDCMIKTKHGIDPEIKVEPVSIAWNSALPEARVTMSCIRPGAAIWYTLDGSFPSSGNTSATLYQGSFNLASAATVRAAAYLAGMHGSDITQLEIN